MFHTADPLASLYQYVRLKNVRDGSSLQILHMSTFTSIVIAMFMFSSILARNSFFGLALNLMKLR